MGPLILLVVWTSSCVAIGIFIAGANPRFAAKWDAFRRKALGLR